MKPRFVLLCDYAFITSDNKLSIIGEFDRLVHMGGGEMALNHAFLVGSFVGSEKKDHKIMIQFVSVSGEEFSPSKELIFHTEKGGKANALVKLINLSFPSQGKYFMQFVDENKKVLGKASLDVVAMTNVISE